MSESEALSFKIGMVGDQQIGKTSLMVKYVQNEFDEDYILTLGVNFMEKKQKIRGQEVVFNIWDLGGAKEFVNMLPLVCNDASAILFMFDLTRESTLVGVKEWYRQARKFNKKAAPFLVGTKFDLFIALPPETQASTVNKARAYAKAMKCPLIFASARISINVKNIFKIVLAKLLDFKPQIEEIHEPLCPILELEPYAQHTADGKEEEKL
ncbi:Spg1, Ras superfamily GTPase [Monocercomonoides exilis]|uniref:Spg1, Ras superfamily GTPase n=1 Tax=Monocercomonoides exilis TaxID=2049356 RepID=UPI00355AB4D6|nr:Spg1, Ras superfamily GTPase [Monocercomonoides exilis]|eukprot:MONOS_9968.1-p1 / transcript=MONOS_9968.1 / gene=MONOS_9968 / organism=Monocercomonoides_exilis_PA203 / gene_product=Spg1, Ras superfamily GTPase / transcript_product=Spg1, Ras superfamily GTPase / location=Mono_scaffold00432:32330-33115(-) / protein_length=210 / sequence_SO=supercontig / SO=protein_coding / is_pseudo=false